MTIYKAVIIGIILIGSVFLAKIHASTNLPNITTIVLIDGEAHLVELRNDGELLSTYGAIPSYFSSNKTHEELVEISMKKYHDMVEMDLDRLRFLVFEIDAPFSNEDAVDHIRDLAIRAEQDPTSIITITTGRQKGSTETETRLSMIIELFQDFGLPTSQIKVIDKNSVSYSEYEFFKIEFNPSLY